MNWSPTLFLSDIITASFRMWTPSSHTSVRATDSMKGEGGHFSWSSLFLTATSQCLSAERAVLWKGRGNLPSLYVPINDWLIWKTPEEHFDPKNDNTQRQRNDFCSTHSSKQDSPLKIWDTEDAHALLVKAKAKPLADLEILPCRTFTKEPQSCNNVNYSSALK